MSIYIETNTLVSVAVDALSKGYYLRGTIKHENLVQIPAG